MKKVNIAHPLLDSSSETSLYKPYRPILGPQQLRDLSRLRPWIPVLHTAWFWLGIIAAWAFVYLVREWWAVLIALPVIGTRFYGLYIIGHDGMHRRVFNNTNLNDRFCDLFIFGPIGAITRINNKNHIEHHQHLGTELDPDRYKHACFNKATRLEFLFFFTGLSAILRAIRNVYLRPRRQHRPMNTSERKVLRYRLTDLAILLGWQAALIGGLTAAFGWWGYPVLWLLPVYLFTYLGDLARSFLEHAHPEADSKADTHRLITFRSNPVERIFLAPCNMNYHAAHHLWTSIPYYNLPAADRILKADPRSTGLEWRGSYLAYAWHYFTKLPLPECKQQHRPA